MSDLLTRLKRVLLLHALVYDASYPTTCAVQQPAAMLRVFRECLFAAMFPMQLERRRSGGAGAGRGACGRRAYSCTLMCLVLRYSNTARRDSSMPRPLSFQPS